MPMKSTDIMIASDIKVRIASSNDRCPNDQWVDLTNPKQKSSKVVYNEKRITSKQEVIVWIK